ncbi:hypothetical protein [Streptomyces europaeiscabiei]|uniref:hypothetical protein n=1 Tax=Streptomyces europaeiscabiei TaxID=146819 RepID=UPI0029BBE839|nr:hypothetical protein [Streptomyces europaeiscabiei]MDX2758333.1 hypothetical protein [Streptomyces europaeiscabiei]
MRDLDPDPDLDLDLDLDLDQERKQERKQEQEASSSMTSAVDSGAWNRSRPYSGGTAPTAPGAAAAADLGPCAHTRQLYRRSGRPATP